MACNLTRPQVLDIIVMVIKRAEHIPNAVVITGDTSTASLGFDDASIRLIFDAVRLVLQQRGCCLTIAAEDLDGSAAVEDVVGTFFDGLTDCPA